MPRMWRRLRSYTEAGVCSLVVGPDVSRVEFVKRARLPLRVDETKRQADAEVAVAPRGVQPFPSTSQLVDSMHERQAGVEWSGQG